MMAGPDLLAMPETDQIYSSSKRNRRTLSQMQVLVIELFPSTFGTELLVSMAALPMLIDADRRAVIKATETLIVVQY